MIARFRWKQPLLLAVLCVFLIHFVQSFEDTRTDRDCEEAPNAGKPDTGVCLEDAGDEGFICVEVADGDFDCQCAEGYHEETATGPPPGNDCIENKLCTTDNDCTDEGTTTVCNKAEGYCDVPEKGNPITAGKPGSCCLEDAECNFDKHGVCTDELCKCKTGFTIANEKCVEVGALNGVCAAVAEESVKCPRDDEAICTADGMCMCKPTASPYAGICVVDGNLNGKCDNGACKDKNADCMNDMCMCKPGWDNIGNQCIQKNRLLGKCENTASTCQLDKNAECMDKMCMCKDGYSARGGMCVQNGKVRGKCSNSNGIPCSGDKYAVCQDGFCQCKPGTTEISNKCILVGTIGSMCDSSSDCTEKFQVCDSGMCMCTNGFSLCGGSCIPHNHVGGMCRDLDATCTGDKNAVCKLLNGHPRCECKTGYTAIAGYCVKNGSPGGFCNAGACDDRRSSCVDGMCMCQMKSTLIGGLCIRDGCIGGACCAGTRKCKGRKMACDSLNMCQCKPGYYRSKSKKGSCRKSKKSG